MGFSVKQFSFCYILSTTYVSDIIGFNSENHFLWSVMSVEAAISVNHISSLPTAEIFLYSALNA